MYDLAVIGCGFFGAAAVTQARARGAKVLVIDSGEPHSGSRNASGMYAPGWYKGKFFQGIQPAWWSRECLTYGVGWLEEHWGLTRTGEDVLTLYGPRQGGKKYHPACWVLKKLGVITPVGVVQREVVSLKRITKGWELGWDGGVQKVGAVVLAAGAATDKLLTLAGLPAVGVKPLPGQALLLDGVEIPRPLRVLRSAYIHYTYRPWPGGKVRVGDTVEPSATGPTEKGLTGLAAAAEAHLPGSRLAGSVYGIRPACKKVVVEKVTPGLVAATGGHRVGLGLAPACARRSLQLLGFL